MTPPTTPSPTGATRAGDADRERIAADLRRHHAEGRLDTDELQERIDRCFESRTVGDLDGLIADLPGNEPSLRDLPARGLGGWRWSPLLLVGLVMLLGAIGGGWHHHPHPPLIVPVIGLVLLFAYLRRSHLWRLPGTHSRHPR